MKVREFATAEEGLAALAQAQKKPHKYRAQRTTYQGQMFDSRLEAEYARDLDVKKAAGQIKSWSKAEPIELIHGNRSKRVTYIPDFMVVEPDNRVFYVDVKGVELPIWKLKMKMLRDKFPTLRLLIVSKKGERWLP